MNPTPGVVFLYLELCRGPELQQLIDARGALAEGEARLLARQMIGKGHFRDTSTLSGTLLRHLHSLR